jgi:uncharacterized protein YjbI with pentapeptide repeats
MNFKSSPVITALLVSSMVLSPIAVHSQEADRRELYQLCSRSPLNSRCAGQNIPIPLSARMGESSKCVLYTGKIKEASPCKMVPIYKGLIVYVETGEPIKLLDNQRGTKAVRILGDRIFALNYQVWDKTHRAEIGFLVDSDATSANRTNFLELLGDDELETWLKPRLNAPPLSPELWSRATASSTATASPTAGAAAVKQLLATKECVGCNLAGADLSNAKLAEANLEGANLQGANLQGVNLEAAYLVGANLDQTNLTKANLRYANLTMSSLQDAMLENAEMAAINLQGATASRANLQGATLTAPAMLQGVNLARANLQDAKLEGAMLANANLTGANLQGADLSDTSIRSSGLRGGTSFGQALGDWAVGGLLGVGIGALSRDGVKFATNLQGANLSSANLTGANLEDALLMNANFTGANFTKVKLANIDLTRANLCGATMPNGDRSNQGCQ